MARKEHFIPKLYLKGFLDPNSLRKNNITPYLWCVDVRKGKIRASSTKNIAKISGFYDYKSYDTSLEDYLTKIESLAAPIIEKFRNLDYKITEEDRFHLSVYLGLQIGRVPAYRDSIQTAAFKNVKKEINRILDGNDKNINVVPPDNFSDYLIGVSLKVGLDFWTKIVFSMNWIFITPPEEIQFYCTDNPASLLVPFGSPFKIDENLQLWFPISPKCALLGQFTDVPDGLVDSVDSEIATSFNLGILPTIQRYAFCATKEQGKWILKHYQGLHQKISGQKEKASV